MSDVTYSESFIEQAQARLREMVEKKLDRISYGEPFSSFYVVIGNTDKRKVAVVEIPEDLKEKIGDNKVYVITD